VVSDLEPYTAFADNFDTAGELELEPPRKAAGRPRPFTEPLTGSCILCALAAGMERMDKIGS
jgi:hypothetical protein